MPEPDERFDQLLEAMVTKPGPDTKVKPEAAPEPEEDLREDDDA